MAFCGKAALWSGLLLGFVTGCASAPPPTCKVPQRVELEIETSERVNPDARGSSLPTRVRLYQLTDLSRLQSASFEEVWEDNGAALQQAVVEPPIDFTMYPGQIAVQRFKRNEDADYLIGVAVFREQIGASWRTINEWPLPGDPCAAKQDADAAPSLDQLRVRMFLRDYRIDSTNNYVGELPTRSCPAGKGGCEAQRGSDELRDALRGRRLRTFSEDPSAPKPTTGTQP